MSIKVSEFGLTKNNDKVYKISLENKNGTKASFLNYGAIWQEFIIKDAYSNEKDVVLGFNEISAYEEDETHIGAVVGRYANRIENASFILNGVKYELDKNSGSHNLHSGYDYYGKRIWDFELIDETYVVFKLFSKDLDQGFPGDLNVEVSYKLDDNDAIIIEYSYISNKDTVVNMTQHAYFNLEGEDSPSVLDHLLMINAKEFTYINEDSVATGEIRKVENTPLDFRKEKRVGKDIEKDYDSLKMARGYDQNFILSKDVLKEYDNLKLALQTRSEKSKISMEVYTDLEGVQFYTANYLRSNKKSKSNNFYKERSAFCFETGHFPNALNIESFKSPIILADKKYSTKTIYKFDIKKD